MEVVQTKLSGVLLVKPDVFEDFRGGYVETYNEAEYQKHGINVRFVQDDLSFSTKGVLRGLHGDQKTWKLISCAYGKFYLAVVNCDESSPDFGKWDAFTLSDRNRWQVLVPPKHGNGHLALTDHIVFSYKQSEYFMPGIQFSYRYDDPRFKIWWPIKNPVLSARDEAGKYV